MIRPFLAPTVLCGFLSIALGAEFDLSWHSIDAGGVIKSAGGAFEPSGMIGQPDAGTMSGGSFELTGGFWLEISPTDCNEDGAANLTDHSSFTDCLAGPCCYHYSILGFRPPRCFAPAQGRGLKQCSLQLRGAGNSLGPRHETR